MNKIKLSSVLILLLIPVLLCCGCTNHQQTITPIPTTPQPTAEATPTATKSVIDKTQAIAIAREAAIELLGYDSSRLATESDMEALENEDFETLMKGELRYITNMETMTPEVKKIYFKDRETWAVDFNSIFNTKCIALGVSVCVDVETGHITYIDRTVGEIFYKMSHGFGS
jgi:hypothetical protein